MRNLVRAFRSRSTRAELSGFEVGALVLSHLRVDTRRPMALEVQQLSHRSALERIIHTGATVCSGHEVESLTDVLSGFAIVAET